VDSAFSDRLCAVRKRREPLIIDGGALRRITEADRQRGIGGAAWGWEHGRGKAE
jgi:hypothetical protein